MEHFTVQQQNDDASCAEKQVGIMFVATVGPKEGTAKGAKVTPIPMLPSQQQPLSTPTKRSSNLTGGNSRGEKRSKCQRLDAYISLNSAATIQPSADDDTEKSSLAKELVARALAAVSMRGNQPVGDIETKTDSNAASATLDSSLLDASVHSTASKTNKHTALLFSPRNRKESTPHTKFQPQRASIVAPSATALQPARFQVPQLLDMSLQSSLPTTESMRFRSTPTLLQSMRGSSHDSYRDPARMTAATMTAHHPPRIDNPGLVPLLCSGSGRSTAFASSVAAKNFGVGQCRMPQQQQQHHLISNGDTQSMWLRTQSSAIPSLLWQSTMLQPFPAPMSNAFVHRGNSTESSMEPAVAAYSYCHQMYRHLERPQVSTMTMSRPQQSTGYVTASTPFTMTATIPLPAILGSATDSTVMSDHQALMRLQIEVFIATVDDVTSHVKGRNRRIHVGQVGIRCRHCAHLSLAQRGYGTVYFPSATFGLYQAAQNMSAMHLQCGRCPEMPDAIKQRFVDLLPTKNVNSKVGRKYWAERAVEMFGLVDTEAGVIVQTK